MTPDEIKEILKQTDLFADATDDFLTKISALAHYKKLAKNEMLITENSISKEIYVIVSGHFTVCKIVETGNTTEAQFNMLEKCAVVGELSFIDEQPRSANVKALDDDCAAIEIQKKDIIDIAPTSFYQKLSKKLSHHLRHTNEIIIANLKKEIALVKQMANMGRFITYVLLLISFYNLTLAGFISLGTNSYVSMFASTPIIAIFTIVMFILVKRMNYPLSRCGINLHEWPIVLTESILFTSIFIAVLTFSYWIFLQLYDPSIKLFRLDQDVKIFEKGTSKFYVWLIIGMTVYALFAVFQEFISRGVLQGALQDFLTHKHKDLIANIVTSGVFASMHVHLSSNLAYLVFVPSLFWGWLYIRHRSLLGPLVSHILVGWWGIFVLGLQNV